MGNSQSAHYRGVLIPLDGSYGIAGLPPPRVTCASSPPCPSQAVRSPRSLNLYHYRAVVTDVHDGDTVTVDIDLGFHVWVRGEHIRFAGMDAPELHGDTKVQGEASRDFLRDLVLEQQAIIETIKARDGGDKQEKYGRYLGVIWLEGTNVNELLVTQRWPLCTGSIDSCHCDQKSKGEEAKTIEAQARGFKVPRFSISFLCARPCRLAGVAIGGQRPKKKSGAACWSGCC